MLSLLLLLLFLILLSFQNLLSVNKNDNQAQFDCVKLFDVNPEISTAEFSQKEITDSLKAMKPIQRLAWMVLH